MQGASKGRRGGWSPASWERRGTALLPMPQFLRRVAFNLFLGTVFIAISLALGMAGYAYFEGMGATESFLNASMILSGMYAMKSTTAARIRIIVVLSTRSPPFAAERYCPAFTDDNA